AGRTKRGAQDGAENSLILPAERRKQGGTAQNEQKICTFQLARCNAGEQSKPEKCTLKFPAEKILNQTYLAHYLSRFSAP
ncbi:MAG: hypothetical protein IKX21_07385, partial [Deltaproteobacteria bacterium]|nr:hypothetical protein [Deltaproteobacteria bacterium]